MQPSNDLPSTLAPLILETSAAKAKAYAALTADFNPIHLDADFAAATPFGKPIAHGTTSLCLLLRCLEKSLGATWRVADVQIRFAQPVPIGETVIAGGEKFDDDPFAYQVHVQTLGGARVVDGVVRVAPAT